MKKLVIAAAALVVGTVSASAADLAARPYTKAPVAVAAVYNWTGFYIGGQVGYAWGDNHTTEFVTATGLPSGFNQNYNTNGVVGGVHAGYNWQFGQFVFGLEGDVEGADIKGGYRLVNTNGTDYRLRDQASIRGRAGVAFNNSLLYVTGGAAFADIEHTYVFANTLFEGISCYPYRLDRGRGLGVWLHAELVGPYRVSLHRFRQLPVPLHLLVPRIHLRRPSGVSDRRAVSAIASAARSSPSTKPSTDPAT